MGTIRLTLHYHATKDGKNGPEDFNGGSNWWAGLDNTGLGQMVSMAAEVEEAVKKHNDKGGPITVKLWAEIDGIEAPPEMLEEKTYEGLTLHGYNKVEEEMQEVGKRLVKMGKDHADKKEGPKADKD